MCTFVGVGEGWWEMFMVCMCGVVFFCELRRAFSRAGFAVQKYRWWALW